MPVLNITCPICTEVFQNSDDIYTTSCGHIYHFICMRDWQSRATSCPQCRSYNPTTHKLYLSFDDSDENSTEMNELKVKLQSSTEKIQALYDQLREGDTNFLHLQEQRTSSEELIRELEERVRQSIDSERNFLHLHGQYTESENLKKELQDSMQLLTIDNESKSKELNLKSLKIATLKASLEAIESQSSEFVLLDKIKILEQKLTHISAELEKEITNSTQLSIDKMKLQSYIAQMKLEASAINENAHTRSKDLKNKSVKSTVSNSKQQILKNKVVNLGESPLLCDASNSEENNLLNSSTSLIIRNYPMNKIVYPLENIIIKIASEIDLVITKEDLSKVNIKKRNKYRQLPNTVSLIVQFKSLGLKEKFFSNKNRLKNKPSTEFLTIKEYMDDMTHSVFVYANRKLRGNGFQNIICKNNQIFAKKHSNDPNSVRIFSTNQVDELLREG